MYSAVFLVFAFYLLPINLLSSLASLIIAILLFPKTFEYIQRKTGIKIKNDLKTAIISLLFLLMGFSASKSIGLNTESQNQKESKPKTNNSTKNILYKVDRVLDGDTVDVIYNNELMRIRLIGIDAPETGGGNTKKECYADESKKYLTDLLNNDYVKLENDETQNDKDRYDRSLRYVFLEELNINKDLVEKGYAKEYTFDKPYKYSEEFLNAEKSAINLKIGIWNPQICPN